ncbi:MAG: hypothetical protein K0S01_2488 [Herbinix sp.]|jgi:flagellar capping protein FliD|nr:hypothetical protein [Herbinix sp.]
MYNIDVDEANKIIKIVLSGHMLLDEIEAYAKELDIFLNQYEDNIYSLFASAERLDPISQNGLPIFIDIMKVVLTRFNKIATVHKRTITRMQMSRIEAMVTSNGDLKKKIMRFNTTKEAFSYLRK